MSRHGTFVPFAGLAFFPGVRQNTHRTRQYEESAAQRRRKPKLRENNAGGAVDVHRNCSPFASRERCFGSAADGGKKAGDMAGSRCFLHELQKARRARIGGMEAMTETGNMFDALV